MIHHLKKLKTFLTRSTTWKKFFADGCAALKSLNYLAAEASFSQALQSLPSETTDLRLYSTLVGLSIALRGQEAYHEAETHLRRAIQLCLNTKPEPTEELAYALKELGVCFNDQGRSDLGLHELRSALNIYERSKGGACDDDKIECLFHLCRALTLQGEYSESLERIETVLTKFRGKDERSAELTDLLYCKAVAQHKLSLYGGAEDTMEEALALYLKTSGRMSTDFANCISELASAILAQERFADASSKFSEALTILDELEQRESPPYADSLTGIATCLRMQGQFEQAEDYYRQALSIYEKLHGEGHENVISVVSQLAVCHSEQGKFKEAEHLFKRAIDCAENLLSAEYNSVSDSLFNLANCYAHQKKWAEAAPLYARALDILETTLGAEHIEVAAKLSGLAYCLQLQERYAEAEPLYKRAVDIYENRTDFEDTLADNLIGLANCQLETGNYLSARPLYERALKVKQSRFDPKDQELAGRLEDLIQEIAQLATSIG